MWRGPSLVPSLLKFYLFNVTNSKEVEEGGKPIFDEVGPYAFKQIKQKVDVKPGEIKNDTIQYRNLLWLYFSKEFSNGSIDDIVTTINVPFVGIAKLASNLTSPSLTEIDGTLTKKGETLFKTSSVQELLLDGFNVEHYISILGGSPEPDMAGMSQIPETFRTGKFALLNRKNGSDDGIYEVDIGIRNYNEVGQIQVWNNYTSLPWWKHESCNNISNSTDGVTFAPFITRQTLMKTFSTEACRRLPMVYDNDMTYKRVPGYKFILDKKIFLGVHQNQENWCYCVEDNQKNCERNGIIPLSGCSDGMPLWMSSPHFLGAENSLVDEIQGMFPDDKKHTTFINIEPDTAIILQAAKRFQINIQLEQIKEMPTFSKVRNIMFPIMWVEESFELTDNYMQIFAQMQTIMDLVDQGRWILIVSSLGAVGIGVVVGMLKREKLK